MHHQPRITDRFVPRFLTRGLPCPEGPPLRRSFRPFAVIAAVVAALSAPDATAALSRWSASNNRIYVYGGGNMTLTDISSSPDTPVEALQRVDASGIWLLNANIIVEEGTVLMLTGDVKELRMKSTASSAPATDVTSFIGITAGNFDTTAGTGSAGAVKIDGVKVTSWDTGANGPDTSSADGRAFIRARSALASAVPQISRLDILNSEVQYLGYEASERYGLAWKANGTEEQLASGLVHVLGDIKNSKIHHNHYGAYSFGLKGGQWTGNEVYSNDGYGLDAHDHSDDLVIDGNNVHDNGKIDEKGRHGIILSESCLNARITNNTSSGNGGIDGTTGSPEGVGIMLHNFSDDAIVEGNTTSNNVDSGIAVFCSRGALVKNNTAAGNQQYGIRLTVAARDNTIEANTISGSGEYGIYMQPATDSNGVCGDLTPRNNTVTGNTIGTSGVAALKVQDATDNTFTGNTLEDGVSVNNRTRGAGMNIAFDGNTFGQGAVVRLDGAPEFPLAADFTKTANVSLELDTGSTARFADDAGAIFDLARDLLVQVNGSNSSLELNADNTTGPVVVDTRALFITTDGTLVEAAPIAWDATSRSWIARAQNAAGTVQYKVGDLEAGAGYAVKRGDVAIGSFTAASDGSISFSDAPGSSATQTYAVTRTSAPPQAGGSSGGGGAGDPAWLFGLLVAALRRALGRDAALPALAGRR